MVDLTQEILRVGRNIVLQMLIVVALEITGK